MYALYINICINIFVDIPTMSIFLVKKWTKKQRIQVALVAPEAREIHGATRRLLAPMDPEATVPAGHVVVALPRRALQRQLKPAR